MGKLREEFKQLEDLVFYCLKNFPETRGEEMELYLKIWDLQGFRLPKKIIPFFLYKIARPESISRARRRLQGQGFYRADSLKTAQRSLRGMEFRQLFGGAK